ncbi:MAG: hypothetical protein CMK65_03260 [Pseudoalteromonas sp.]|uniref:S41 family peptidase n=1 Tax=Pseudoalteromonas sp. TaxID=53249 RepID=UPI000C94AC3A|nr:S41 family peptidase [Pseudoalteromonas sp.]MAD02630.1 hypothetical protein [Pseudoalteromonas sp.]|tara:strand:- start:1846 stop:2745 length:900 start_codon:yes stop_codon:yes gene_type:complete
MKKSYFFTLMLFTLISSFVEAEPNYDEVKQLINKHFIRKNDYSDKSAYLGYKTPNVATLLKSLNEPHTYLKDKDSNIIIFSAKKRCVNNSKIKLSFQKGKLAYLKVSSIGATTTEEKSQYVRNSINNIRSQDNENSRYWIIDLRKNSGGNMWPMLQALSPFFDATQTLGEFHLSSGSITRFGFKDGIAHESTLQKINFQPDTYHLKHQPIGIFVLIDSSVASSAEALAIGLSSLNNVTLVGEKTCGLATVNTPFELSDESILVLTTGEMANIHGKTFKNGIKPSISSLEFSTLIKDFGE